MSWRIDRRSLLTGAGTIFLLPMLERFFTVESELALNVRDGRGPDDAKTPINYACVLLPK